jgi:hypothetical protein
MTKETLIAAAIGADEHLWRSQAQMMAWWFKRGHGTWRSLPPLVAKHLNAPPTRADWADIGNVVKRERRKTSGRPRAEVQQDLKDEIDVRRQMKLQLRREYMRNLMRERRSHKNDG